MENWVHQDGAELRIRWVRVPIIENGYVVGRGSDVREASLVRRGETVTVWTRCAASLVMVDPWLRCLRGETTDRDGFMVDVDLGGMASGALLPLSDSEQVD